MTPISPTRSSGFIPLQERVTHRSNAARADPDGNADQSNPLLPADHVPPRSFSRITSFLRSMRLSILVSLWIKYGLKKSDTRTDEPKIAIMHDRRVALLGAGIHVLPLLACITLLFFNLRGFYIGSELQGPAGIETVKQGGLQFAAKLHELTMLASLSVVVCAFIRRELALGQGVPFGAVFASVQYKDVSFLWSKEFWATIRAPFATRVRKIALVSVIVGATLLALSVGPSSAVLMVPKLSDWPAGGTDFWLKGRKEDIWPSQVDATDVPSFCTVYDSDFHCPSGGWEGIGSNYAFFWRHLGTSNTKFQSLPGRFQIPSDFSTKTMYMQSRGGSTSLDLTLATVPQSTIANALVQAGLLWSAAVVGVNYPVGRSFRYRLHSTWSVRGVQQPVTVVSCMNQSISSNSTISRLSFHILDSVDKSNYNNSKTYYQSDYVKAAVLNQTQHLIGGARPSILWVDLPHSDFGNTSIGAIAVFPKTQFSRTAVLTCAVDSRWMPVSLQSITETRFARAWVVDTASPPDNAWRSRSYTASLPRISIAPEWASYLNPTLIGQDETVFERLAGLAGTWNAPPETFYPDQFPEGNLFIPAVESLFAALVTNGLSRLSNSSYIQGTLKRSTSGSLYDYSTLVPQNGQVFGNGGMVWNMSGVDTSNMSRYTMTATVYGYAYSSSSGSALVSATILLLYCTLVLIHIIYAAVSGISSTSWDTTPEITALAIQSRPSLQTLKNTCAGISRGRVFEALVRIVGFENHLEMVFDEDKREGATGVLKNHYYG